MKPPPKHRALALEMARAAAAMREGTRLHNLLDVINDPRALRAIIAALRHCQGMGHPLPITEAETDALCVRLGDQQ